MRLTADQVAASSSAWSPRSIRSSLPERTDSTMPRRTCSAMPCAICSTVPPVIVSIASLRVGSPSAKRCKRSSSAPEASGSRKIASARVRASNASVGAPCGTINATAREIAPRSPRSLAISADGSSWPIAAESTSTMSGAT
jgi:hypothetical protein